MGPLGALHVHETEIRLDVESMAKAFHQRFGQAMPRFFYAPGRVNLIGEHTDYNQGFVLPIAIDYGTMVAGVSRPDRIIRACSLNEGETIEFDLDSSEAYLKGSWINYVEGVARSLEREGFALRGADLLIGSSVPVGAGLSSSAALENGVGFALLNLSGHEEFDRVRMALAGQAAEHQYVGTQCGIMDQLITAMGQADHALLIDCRSLETTPVPLHLGDRSIVICDSRVKHSLASSAYNQRVQECRQGVEFLKRAFPEIQSLRDVSLGQWELHEGVVTDTIVRKRVRHVITENARTLAAVEALMAGRIERLGQLMAESHESLKTFYEVSAPELDTLVDIASSIPGVLGARMTGGGFGGCTINLVENVALKGFIQTITQRYADAFGQPPLVYVTRAAEGVHEVSAPARFFPEIEVVQQQTLNRELNQVFSQGFQYRQLGRFIEFVRRQIPPVVEEWPQHLLEGVLSQVGDALPEQAEIRAGETRLAVSKEFGIRLYYRNRQLTTDWDNIPRDYPWFLHDPEDPEDIAGFAARHVARGSRGESPWPESLWPQVGGVVQGEQHWPHRSAAFGPYRLALAEEGGFKAILLSLPEETPNAYGVIPRGLFTVTPEGGVVLALQHVNYSSAFRWSPWFVLGFAMPKRGTIKNPSTVLAFPDSIAQDPVQGHMSKVWNYMWISGRKLAVINPHAKTLNEPFKKLYRDTNWSVIASKGWDYCILTRSILRHEEQFFPFLEHGRHFIEVEHTGPRVAQGETSTVLVQHDILPLGDFTRGKITVFNEDTRTFEQEVRAVLERIVALEKDGRLVTNYRQA